MNLDEIFKREDKFQYMLLDRMRSDCDYYLGNGRLYGNHLFGADEREHIAYMKAVWEHFPDDKKPEWLTMEQILEYEKKMVDVIREKPFMERSSSQQEFVYSYWFDHAKELECSCQKFLGMNREQYNSWCDGVLRLNDGSYHEMESSVFRLPEEVISKIRNEIANPSLWSELAFSNRVNQLLPKDKHCFVSICDGAKLAYVYDGGDDALAVISINEILYKEDFAQLMKNAGMEATEVNFDKIWGPIRAGHLTKASLLESVMAAITEARSSLDERISDATQKVAAENSSEFHLKNNRFER